MSSLSKFVLAVLLAAPLEAKLLEDTVATVNGTPVLLSEYQKELATVLNYWAKNEPEAVRDEGLLRKLNEGTLEQLIDRELLTQEGMRLKIKVRERDIDSGIAEIKERFKVDEAGRPLTEAQAEKIFQDQLKDDGLTFAMFREKLGKQVMARKLIDESVRPMVKTPTDDEVKGYFKKIEKYISSKSTVTPSGMSEEEGIALHQVAQQVKAMSSERVRVARILVRLSPSASEAEKKRALKAAQDIRKKLLEENASFAEIAKVESEDEESAKRGGDIGYVMRGVAPPEFEKVAFSLAVGEISEPILTENGYHIIRVLEKRASESPDLERFKDDLVRFLSNVSFQKELEKFMKALRAKAVIEKNPAATR